MITGRMLSPLLLLSLMVHQVFGQMGNYASHARSDRSVIISDASGEKKIRITPYGDYIVRFQTVREMEAFYADDHYLQVERHDWEGTLNVDNGTSSISISTQAVDDVSISISKNPLTRIVLQ